MFLSGVCLLQSILVRVCSHVGFSRCGKSDAEPTGNQRLKSASDAESAQIPRQICKMSLLFFPASRIINVNYCADFPFKGIGCGIKSFFEEELDSDSVQSSCPIPRQKPLWEHTLTADCCTVVWLCSLDLPSQLSWLG